MLATQTAYGGNSLHGTSQSLKNDISEIANSGNFYVTPQLCRELKHIGTGVDHINLDDDFQRSSKTWGAKFDPTATFMEKQAAANTMAQAGGSMYDYKNEMNARKVREKQDGDVREAHHWAMHNLKEVQTNMAPYAHQSVDRIKQFCDHIGVTDRYTGYRHNLNRGSRKPFRAGFNWMDNNNNSKADMDVRPILRQSAPAGPRHVTFSQEGRMSAPLTKRHVPAHEFSIQEKSGINTVFPGKTEYMQRYTPPVKERGHQDFCINPIPDFTSYGRPLAMSKYEKAFSEYQRRYLWPDSNTPKLPWLRK